MTTSRGSTPTGPTSSSLERLWMRFTSGRCSRVGRRGSNREPRGRDLPGFSRSESPRFPNITLVGVLQRGFTMAKRRRHPEEFKIEAVRLLLNRGERTIKEIGENLGVSANQLQRWRMRYEKAVLNPRQHARESAEQFEIRRLKKEVDQLKMEREILKKAAAFFAKESR